MVPRKAEATLSENRDLEQRLQRMAHQKEQALKLTGKALTKPVTPKDFLIRDKSYDNVQSNLDYEHTKESTKIKREQIVKLKEEMELKECSFKPVINVNSVNILHNGHYVPITERKQRERTADVSKVEDEAHNRSVSLNDRTKKKLDKDFYEKQLQWQKNKVDKAQKKMIDMTIQKNTEPNGLPKVNKKANEKIVNEKGIFMERLNDYKEKSDNKKKDLDAKYYDYSFKPKINEFAVTTATHKVQKNIFKVGLKDL